MTTILIVDDIVPNRYLLEMLFKGLGYETLSAEHGAQAWELVQQHPVDLVVSDILMPVMDGYELCRRMKTSVTLRRIPFLFYTATYMEAKDEAFALSLGAEYFLRKPMEPEALAQIVGEMLARAETKPPAEPECDLEYLGKRSDVLSRKLDQKMSQLDRLLEEREELNEVLQITEKRYTRLFQAMTDAFVETDMAGRIVGFNPVYQQMLGYSEADLLSKTYQDITPERWHAYEQEIVEQRIMLQGASEVYEKEYRRKDGSIFPVELRTFLVRDEVGRPLGMWALVRDVTERKALHAQRDRSAQLYATLALANEAIVHAVDRNLLFQAITEICIQRAHFDLAWIGWIDRERRFVEPVVASGAAADYTKQFRIPCWEAGELQGPISRCVQEARPVLIQDWALDETVAHCNGRSLHYGLRSSADLPLMQRGQVVGLISLHAKEPGFFSDDRVHLLVELAQDLSFALDVLEDRQRLERRARQQAAIAELGLLVVQGVGSEAFQAQAAAVVARILALPLSMVLLLEPDGTDLKLVAGVGWGEGLVGSARISAASDTQAGSALASATPVVVEDLATEVRFQGCSLLREHGGRSGISVVIGNPSSPYGVLGAHETHLKPFYQEDVAFLQGVAHWIAAALDLERRERGRAAALAEANRLRNALDAVPVHVYMKDRESRYRYANQSTLDLFGCTAEALVGAEDARFFPAETVQRLREVDLQVLSGSPSREEIAVPHADGSASVYLEIKTPLPGEVAGDPPGGLLGISTDITSQKRVEAALSYNNSVLQGILESSDAPIFSLDGDYRYTSFNRAHAAVMTQLYGVQIHLGDHLSACMTVPEDWAQARTNLNRAMEGTSFLVEGTLGVQGNTQRTYQVRHQPVRNDAHEVVGVAVFASDITEESLTRLELTHAHELLGQMQRIARVGGWEVDLGRQKLTWSEGVYRIHELDPDSYVPEVESSIQFYAPEWRSVIQQAMQSAISEGRSFDLEMELITGRGRRVWVRAIGEAELWEGKAVRVYGAFLDIDAEKRALDALRAAEQLLEAQERRHRAVFETAADGIVLLDKDTLEILGANPAFCQTYGYTLEELLTMKATDVSAQAAETERATRGSTSHVRGRLHRRKDGTVFPVDLVAGNFEEDGRRISVVSSRDITEAMAATEALNRFAEDLDQRVKERTTQLEAANSELQAFSYSVSHDLRAPLRSMTGFAQAMREDCGDHLDPTANDYLDRILRAGQRMAQLIEDMLKLSRLSQQDFNGCEVDLSHLGQDICETLALEPREHAVSWAVQPGMRCFGDLDLLRIALDNLLRNAWKFTAGRSEQEVYFEQVDENVFRIRDTGVGFPAAKADWLFTPFVRLHTNEAFAGTGLGLAIVRRVMNRHGGKAWAEGEEGKGAAFYFSVPLRDT